MRIGRTIIDIENMSIEDLKTIEHEIHTLRRRREKAESFKERLRCLYVEAQDEGFDFVDKDFGNIIRIDDVEIYDNR